MRNAYLVRLIHFNLCKYISIIRITTWPNIGFDWISSISYFLTRLDLNGDNFWYVLLVLDIPQSFAIVFLFKLRFSTW